MAEAYFNSLKIKDWVATSSGIDAVNNIEGAIAWDTKDTLQNHNILEYTNKDWTQTTKELIEDSDLVIFMEPTHATYCEQTLHAKIPKHEIWNVIDTDINKDKTIVVLESESTFQAVKKQVDALITRI